MNEELKEKAGAVLLDLLQDFTKAKEFAIEQAPEVVQELLAWNYWSSLLLCVIGIAMVLAGLFCALTLYKRCSDWERDYVVVLPVICVIGAVVGLVGGSACFGHNLDWLQILIAPKLYLIEYVRGF